MHTLCQTKPTISHQTHPFVEPRLLVQPPFPQCDFILRNLLLFPNFGDSHSNKVEYWFLCFTIPSVLFVCLFNADQSISMLEIYFEKQVSQSSGFDSDKMF